MPGEIQSSFPPLKSNEEGFGAGKSAKIVAQSKSETEMREFKFQIFCRETLQRADVRSAAIDEIWDVEMAFWSLSRRMRRLES